MIDFGVTRIGKNSQSNHPKKKSMIYKFKIVLYWQCFIGVFKVSILNFVCPVVSKSFFQKLDDGWVVPVPVAFDVEVACLQLAELVFQLISTL